MHLNLIKHFLNTNLEVMLKKSLINCHARGVDSILFDDTPGARIRMFIAHANHELWKNGPASPEMTVAIHPHHCDIDIDVVHGFIYNRKFTRGKLSGHFAVRNFEMYRYKSKIKENECKFEFLDNVALYPLEVETCYEGEEETHLYASELHTISIPQYQTAAWVVYEGEEDPNYEPICFSNTDLTKFDDTGMYQLMTRDYLIRLLKKIYNI